MNELESVVAVNMQFRSSNSDSVDDVVSEFLPVETDDSYLMSRDNYY